jgi:hypothetical protein
MGAKTVFILGAGASKPYGYPTGRELRKENCKDFCADINNIGDSVYNDPLQNFTQTFFNSSISSIDLFLSKNPRYERFGKIAIVQRILKAEINSNFAEDIDQNEDWYFYLFNKLLGSTPKKDCFEEFNISDYSFITFNYDRSLEYFLCNSLIHAYSESPVDQILFHINKLKIWHIYGQIAHLSWQKGDFKWDYRFPRVKPDFSYCDLLSNNIKVIHDFDRPTDEIEIIKKEIIAAQRIIFLGFGFAEENLMVLNLPDILRQNKTSRYICSSSIGLLKNEQTKIRNTFSDCTSKSSGFIFAPSEDNCLKILREYVF